MVAVCLSVSRCPFGLFVYKSAYLPLEMKGVQWMPLGLILTTKTNIHNTVVCLFLCVLKLIFIFVTGFTDDSGSLLNFRLTCTDMKIIHTPKVFQTTVFNSLCCPFVCPEWRLRFVHAPIHARSVGDSSGARGCNRRQHPPQLQTE